MLAANPAKAVEEVAHELMHAAQDGLIWPDEHHIGLALSSEVCEHRMYVRDVTAQCSPSPLSLVHC